MYSSQLKTRGRDVREGKRTNFENAEKALKQAQEYLSKIELRRASGDQIDPEIIERLKDVIRTFQYMTR
jgi:hypothetical protein